MQLRNILANRILKGTEKPRMIAQMHANLGCPKNMGVTETSCTSNCKECFDAELTTLQFKEARGYNKTYVVDYNHGC